ncbi:MAG TPA: carboxypeptidase-like regulatory domain-containing protein, partial [Pseudacidobacterium sp.]|nr:carboxypeptidase-like regulatory domain-containing protein [Pseudacidobacterium sp.]
MNSRYLKAEVRLFAGLLVLLLAWSVFPEKVFAQNVYAAIHGTVTDPSGAVVSNASVMVTNTSTGISSQQTTDNKGYYIFPQLAIGGPYTVSITATGFQSFKTVGLVLQLNENRQVDAVLQPGAVAQTIEVTANAIQVETSDTQLKTTVTSNQIEQLPLLGRDPTALQKLTPGTVESSDRFGNFSANGSQTQENAYLLDGADINDTPLQTNSVPINPDAIGETTFVTGTQNPEYSRNSGAIINQTLKSGTNSFHGDAFEFYRDTFLNNGNYFSTTRPVFHQNIFGGTLGGPVIKNRLFFFLAYQGLRNSTATTTVTPVPTDAQLGRNSTGFADLTNDNNVANSGPNTSVGLTSNPLPFTIQGPGGTPCPAGTPWNQCFPGPTYQLPVSDFNSISSNLLAKYVPSPNFNGKFYNFNAANTAGADQGIIRIDTKVTANDQLWASSIFQSNPSLNALPFTGSTLPGFAQDASRHFKIFSASWTHSFNPTTLNELRAGYY